MKCEPAWTSDESPYVGVYIWLLSFLPIAGAHIGVGTDSSEFMLLTAAFWAIGALLAAVLLILVAETVRSLGNR